MNDLAVLLQAPRLKLVARLEPIAGTRFQPTGFPDLGAATYPSPDGDGVLLLVESAQSMANRLEGTLWDNARDEPVGLVASLPYVRVIGKSGGFLTSSRTDSHRLASAYIKAASFNGTKGVDLLGKRLGLVKGQPIDHGLVAREVFQLDPLCLVHGVFFADAVWFGQPKIARATSAFIEARGVEPAFSGGVKLDSVSNSDEESGGAKKGFGNVPFPRTEYVARMIEASFVVDLSQIRRYALEQQEKELLAALALYEIRSLLDGGLRLRTACDLSVVEEQASLPAGFALPPADELEHAIRERLPKPRSQLEGIFGA